MFSCCDHYWLYIVRERDGRPIVCQADHGDWAVDLLQLLIHEAGEKMKISKRMQRVASILADSNQLIAAVQGTPAISENRFQETLGALRRLSQEEKIPIAIVGGAATIHHGYPRSTSDIDIVVAMDDFDRLSKVAYRYGFEMDQFNPYGINDMYFRGVHVEVLQEGMFENDERAAPSPQALGVSTFGFASLAGWVRMKLSAGRTKDMADIVEVLKVQEPDKIDDVEKVLASMPPLYLKKFQTLRQESEAEKAKASLRGG